MVNCVRCKHFYVTWQASFPYGCRAWGIKTRRYPNFTVRESSGLDCQLFKLKDPADKGGSKRV